MYSSSFLATNGQSDPSPEYKAGMSEFVASADVEAKAFKYWAEAFDLRIVIAGSGEAGIEVN